MILDLRRIKALYIIYNFLNYKRLKYLIPLFKKYNIKKFYFSPISSEFFPKETQAERPWLDEVDSKTALKNNPTYVSLDQNVKEAIIDWSINGYTILPGFFSPEKINEIEEELDKLIKGKKMQIKDERKLMNAIWYSKEIRKIVNNSKLNSILELIMGRPTELFQSVNFCKGSEDPAHSDFIHMSTYPYGYLLAVWVAFEDIDLENGPLFYYPGSHKLEYLMNSNFAHGGNKWLIGETNKDKYAEAIEKLIEANNFEKKIFTASKGDVLIWHANLLHGGSKVINQKRTRKSMVMHYFASDVIRYHEITQRPSLKPKV